MTLFSTRLGIIACRYLVQGYYAEKYISAPEIAEYYNMNVRALMPALRQLTRAGILRSRVGGNSPGFIFSKNPKEFSMYHIITVLEGDFKFECCKELMDGIHCDCVDKTGCMIFSHLNRLIDSSTRYLSKISIMDHAKSVYEESSLDTDMKDDTMIFKGVDSD